jgi:uncharacterized protein (TIGR03435 family)
MMSQMLQALLKERFGLQTHLEDRPVKAYKLIAVKPKMHPADPASRTHFREGAGADGVDPRDKNPVLTRLVTVQNMTMAQFAARLQAIASGYVHAPVLDATGLDGGWDFTLSFSAAGMDQLVMRNRGENPNAGEASEPTGSITLMEAVEKIGLKLVEETRAVQVLVIDHVNRAPTEN